MREAGVMLVVNSDGLILAVSRRKDSTKWGLPGGKKEENETPMQAAIRETFEETGILVKNCSLIFKRVEPANALGGLDFYSYCFYASDWEGIPRDSDEGHAVWITIDELIGPNGAFPDYNRNTIRVFKEMYPNVFLKEGS